MGLILFTLTFLCTFDMALNLRALEMYSLFTIEMLNMFVNFSMVFALTLAHYYLSERVTANLLEIGEIFYNSAWYRLPVKHQLLLTLPIHCAQQEIRLNGLGFFDCSLAFFCSVKKSVILGIFLIFFYSESQLLM